TIMFVFDIKFIAYSSSGIHSAFDNLYGTNVFSGSQLSYQAKYVDVGGKINYLLYLNFPYLFLSFMDPVSLLQLPWFAASYITSFSPYYTFGSYYEAYIWPFVVLGAIGGVYKLAKKDGKIDLSRVKRIVAIIFIIMMISWTAQYGISYSQNMPTNISEYNYDYIQALSTIKQGTPLSTPISSVEVSSSYDWNSWIYGGNQQFIIVDANSYPYSHIGNYGLYSSSGPYLVMEKNYTGQPVLNNYKDVLDGSINSPYQNISIFMPSGKYSLDISVYSNNPNSAIAFNSNVSGFKMIDVNQGIIVPFMVNKTQYIRSIITPYKLTQGYYMVNSMITSEMNPDTMIAQSSYGAVANATNYENFHYGIVLQKNVTYYFWEMTSGYPGGMYVPYSHGSSYTFNLTPYQGKYPYFNSIGNQSGIFKVSAINETFPIALVTNTTSDESLNYEIDSNLTGKTTGMIGNQEAVMISSHSSGIKNFTLSFSLMTFAMMNDSKFSITIKSIGYKQYGNIAMDYPVLMLIIPLIVGNGALIGIDKSRFISRHSGCRKYSSMATGISFLAFFTTFILYYFRMLQYTNITLILRLMGIATVIAGAAYLIFIYEDLKKRYS
ncbi:MAG: DUF2079 domain-containing protein, partial [Thermoplasmata archaeon]